MLPGILRDRQSFSQNGRRLLWRRLFAVFVALGVAIAAYYFFTAPTRLRIAVGPESSALYRHARAVADALAASGQPFRLRIVTTSGMADSSAALDTRRADLAILRSDDAISKEAQSVAVLQRLSLIVLARESRGVGVLEDFRGRKVAIVATGGEPSSDLVRGLLSHFGRGADDLTLVEAPQPDAGSGVTAGEYDAIILVLNAAGARARRVVNTLLDRNPDLRFIGVSAADALAARFREVETAEIPVGSFSGAPLRPSKELNTVAMTHEIVARASLDADTVTRFTRALMSARSRLLAGEAREFVMETPDLEETRRFTPHAGTADYVNNESKSFLDVWSDAIWLGLFGVSLLGTSVTAFFGWLGVFDTPRSVAMLRELPAILEELERARTPQETSAVEERIEEATKAFLRDAATGAYDFDQQPDPSPMLRLLGDLVARKRAALAGSEATASPPVPAS